jgi:hypothetical protein
MEVGLGFWFIKIGWGSAGVALASTIAYAVYGSIVVWWVSRYVLPNWRDHLFFIVDVMMPFVLGIFITFLIFWFGHKFIPQRLILRNGIQLLLCISTMLPLAFWLDYKTGIFNDGRVIIDAVVRKFKGVNQL